MGWILLWLASFNIFYRAFTVPVWNDSHAVVNVVGEVAFAVLLAGACICFSLDKKRD